jgi:putative flippase GtrA
MGDRFRTVETQSSAGQLVRYGLVGIASNLSGYLVYLLITYWGVEPQKTMTLLYIVGAAIGFFGNRQLAFAHKGSVLKSGSRYFAAHFFGYLINLLILLTFVDRLGYPHEWVQAAAIFVVAGFLFVAFKYFVFPRTEICSGVGK